MKYEDLNQLLMKSFFKEQCSFNIPISAHIMQTNEHLEKITYLYFEHNSGGMTGLRNVITSSLEKCFPLK